jgi:hypothetical protein
MIGLAISCSNPEDKNNKNIKFPESTSTSSDSLKDKKLIKDLDQDIKNFDLNKIDTFSIGDINGDGIKDKAIISQAKFIIYDNKIDSQYVEISFTCNIPSFKHYNGFQGLCVSVGDLDGNKTEEFIYYPFWYTSNWGGIYIYGYRYNKWALFGSAGIRRYFVDESKNPLKYLQSRVTKIDNKSFKLKEHIWRDSDIVDSVITVKIK